MRLFPFLILFLLIGCGEEKPIPLALDPIEPDLLKRDFELFRQGLEQAHAGLYWYTPKDSFDLFFQQAEAQLDQPLDVFGFQRVLAPLVTYTRETHTYISLPFQAREYLGSQALYLPLVLIFLDQKAMVLYNGSDNPSIQQGQELVSINNRDIKDIIQELFQYIPADGYIQHSKYTNLNGFGFARFYIQVFGWQDQYSVQVLDEDGSTQEVQLQALQINQINDNLATYQDQQKHKQAPKPILEYQILDSSMAYLAIRSFSKPEIRDAGFRYADFLEQTFADLDEKGIQNLIIDIRDNQGGTEGNENLLYSYLGDNFQKYKQVKANSNEFILDNGIDPPINRQSLEFFERAFNFTKQKDGTYLRKDSYGPGLMAYKTEAKSPYTGSVYVLIGPRTYSGASEFANMLYSKKRAIFIGEETGGSFYGNTSGYRFEYELPHSGISVSIPLLKFEMNVEGLPFGRGVIPQHNVSPSFDAYLGEQDVVLEYAKQLIQNQPKQ